MFRGSVTEPSFGKLHHRFVYHRLLVHRYKFKICVHNSLQNNGMIQFVVKILAAGVRRAMESDVLASIQSMQFGKFQLILKFFEIFVNILSFGEGLFCACSAVRMAQVIQVFVHSYCTCVIIIMYFLFCCGAATQRGSWPPHS